MSGSLLARSAGPAPGVEDALNTERAAAPGVPPSRLAGAGRYLLCVAQLAALVALASFFQIEGERFSIVSRLVLAGFVVHALLPMRWRPPFFLLLSLGGLALVLQGNLPYLAGAGAVVIVVCHLPVRLAWRATLLVVAAVALAWLRAQVTGGLTWALFGSIFMFRTILYLHDLQQDLVPASWWHRLSYFFLLPNVLFPLFPVVDPSTYRRTYYNDEPHRIHQRGIVWMVHGFVHLLLYRLVYYQMAIAPQQVHRVADLLQYVLATYLMYLRVSGTFHLAVGMLCLFGYNLPRTHDHYFLASSFTDFWKRINIYWKDFMTKTVFYPVFMRARRWGPRTGLAAATLAVFLVSWALHSYQWLWLRGDFPVSVQDGVFWMGLGLLVTLNSLRTQAAPRRGAGAHRPWRLALQTVGTFACLAVAWSFWTTPSVHEWLALWRLSDPHPAGALLAAAAAAGLAVVLLATVWYRGERPDARYDSPSFGTMAFGAAAALGVIALAGFLPVWAPHNARLTAALAPLQWTSLNQADEARVVRGYYEGLLNANQFNTPLWEMAGDPQRNQTIIQTGAWHFTGDLFDSELLPLKHVSFKGEPLTTNRWGMRDRDYEKARPADTYRIAFVGGSEVMGSAVGNDEMFDPLLETRLNAAPPAGGFRRYEVLNFALEGHFAVQRWMILDRKVFAFEPQAIVYFGHDVDAQGTNNFLYTSLRYHKTIPYPFLTGVLAEAGVTGEMPPALALKRLEPYSARILTWVYEQFVRECRERGIAPIYVFLPSVYERPMSPAGDRETALARAAGFTTIDLSSAYDGYRFVDLRASQADPHPNPTAHRLIAAALYRELTTPRIVAALGIRGDRQVAVVPAASTQGAQ